MSNPFNPAALNTDDYVNEAYRLQLEAKAIFDNPKAGAEEFEKADKMLELAAQKVSNSKRLRELADDTKVLMNNPQKGGGNDPDFEIKWDDWGDYLNAVKNATKNNIRDERLEYEDGFHRMRVTSKTLSSNIGATGGFLNPTQFVPQIRALQAEASIVTPRATVIPIATRGIQLPALNQGQTTAGMTHYFGGIQVYYQGEETALTETNINFRLIDLQAYDLTGLIHVPNNLLSDSAISLSAWIQGPLGLPGAFAHRADYAYLRGTGAGQPMGVLNAGATLSESRASGGSITYDDIVNILAKSLPTPNRVWVAQISSLPELLQIEGPSGNPQYLWGNMVDGAPSRLMGLPIIWTEKMPALGSAGDLLLADFSYYIIAERENILFDTTDQYRWANNITSFKAVMRHDGQPWLELPFTLMDGTTKVSPFVMLAA